MRYIVIHHTATDPNASAEDVLTSMVRRYGEPVPTHYIVDSSGTVLNPTSITEPAGGFSTKNGGLTLDEAIKFNWQSIHIEVVGTWTDTEHPADMPASQLKALKDLIAELQSKYPQATVTAHSLIDKNKGSCGQAILKTLAQPELEQTKPVKKTTSNNGRLNISLSRYYSVMLDQKRYYNNRSYEEDFKMNCSGDPLVTANGHQLTDADKYKSVACPKEYPLGTKFYIEGIGEVVCNDRGGAIVSQGNTVRIDMRCGAGDDALDNWSKCPTGKRKGYVLN